MSKDTRGVDEREKFAEAAAAAVMKFRSKVGGKYYPGYHEDMRDAVREAVLAVPALNAGASS
jgi:hypothetical protein